jgi:excisionase family DNA binding protein
MGPIFVNWMVPKMTRQSLEASVAAIVPPDDVKAGQVLDSRWNGRSTLSVEEAGCEVLGLSRAAAYAAANAGTLPVVRVGRRMVVPRFALEKLLLSAGA